MDILKSNLDRRTGKNSYHIEIYNNLQKLFLVGNRFHHPTAKAVGFPFSVKIVNVIALLNNREYDKFEIDNMLTVDILPAENK